MKFTTKSPIVRAWVSLILAETYTLDDVPELFNLKTVVTEVLLGSKKETV